MKNIESLGYTVFFENSLTALQQFIDAGNYSQIIIMVDRNTNDHCLPVLQAALPELVDYDVIEVDPGEENKNIDFCIGVWNTMLDFGVDRKALMINLGGGVVTDMGGFAASTFKRGIDFVQVPTTLLAQVDASVGGKTGIDLGNLKNIIGTFTQPKAVFISADFLKTLDGRQLRSGFAEVIKHGLIYDRELFALAKTVDEQQDDLNAIVHRSVAIKNAVITEDPTEKGLRKILNFGHTIGHAVEGYSLEHDETPLLHGEAIAVGMICEAYLSHKINGLSAEDLTEIADFFIAKYEPVALNPERYERLVELMRNDKKNEQNKVGFALLREIGACDFDLFADEDLIVESLDYYNSLL